MSKCTRGPLQATTTLFEPNKSKHRSHHANQVRTSGEAGPSVNLSQQSPLLCLWASGSKHSSSEHQANALQGNSSKFAARHRCQAQGQTRVLGNECIEWLCRSSSSGKRNTNIQSFARHACYD